MAASLESLRENKSFKTGLFFGLSFLIALAAYWKTIAGLPIWDDIGFWFNDATMAADNPWQWHVLLTKYNWPVMAIYEKLSLSLWGFNFPIYHITSLLVHAFNSWLVYLIAKKMKWPKPHWIFFLFLLHPASVITVGWMIQIKTLLCFMFVALSTLCFLQAPDDRRWFIGSIVFFVLSILTKASSLPFLLVLVVFAATKMKRSSLLLITPFILIAAVGAVRLLQSPIPQDGQQSAAEQPEVAQAKQANPALQNQNVHWYSTPRLVVKTLSYYVCQAVFPATLHPVKGRFDPSMDLTSWLRLAATVGLAIFFFRYGVGLLFVWGCVFLTPFLGIVPTPFMSISWVSDQHLYLVLPVFIAAFMTILARASDKMDPSPILPVMMIWGAFFFYQTWMASAYYYDEPTFFKASLDAEPTNVAVANDLAVSYIRMQDLPKAKTVVDGIIERSHTETASAERIKTDPYFPIIVELQVELARKLKPQ